MADLISREAALEAIQGLRHAAASNFSEGYMGACGEARCNSFYEAYQAVKGLPAADVVGAPETTLPGGEVEGLVDALIEAAIRDGRVQAGGAFYTGNSAAELDTARTALLAVVRSSGGGDLTNTSGRAPSGSGLSQVEPASGLNPTDFDPSRNDSLNARLKAAGMYSIPEMMGVTPLTRWTVHVGMTDLDFFATWLDQRVSQFLRMKAGYELGDKDKGDELYEWVGAHSAAFSEVRENFRAARAAMAAQAMEARQGGDAEGGSVEDDSAVRKADVPASIDQVPSTPARQEEGSRGDAPAGWVLVPREPTQEMWCAFRGADAGHVLFHQGYRAMLSAAPTPDANSGGEADGRDDQSARFIAESIALEEEEALAQLLFRQDPGAPFLKWDQLWSEIKNKYRQDARIKLSAAPHPSQDTGGADA